MKKTRIAFVILLLLTSGLLLCAVLHPSVKSEKRRAILQLMVSGIEAEHYNPIPVNDTLSKRIYDLYLKRLNSDKLYFTQEDIAQFQPYEYKIDSAVSQGTFAFYDLVNKVWNERLGDDSVYIKKLLTKPFDFSVQENLQYDGNKVSYPKDIDALHERWRKLIKYETLAKLVVMLNDQDKAKEKKDTVYKPKSFQKLEDSARMMVLKTEENDFKYLGEINDTDKINEFFDVIANVYDPHTEYFAPEERKNFDISMSGQLEGIGAQLEDKNGKITIKEIIPGSPAWKSGELKEGDVFLKVAQGAGTPVDIEGMRLDKAVQLIRGKKGTEVKLTIKSGTATKVVSLVRDVIHLEDTYAHAATIDNNGEKIGYIHLPEFYTDFDGTGARRCSDDVRALTQELKGEGVKGIIIDLRDNGGGSLQDVVKMVGIYVSAGPIVQIKSPNMREPQMLVSRDTGALYKGPLIVLVNGTSASASEIFAAAIQDYKRGVIMGSQTYGKGTVQQVFTLDDKIAPAYNSLKPLGSVKITISKFYRINGGTTQKDGVTPDVVMPDPGQYAYGKEKDADYPLSWDKISPANYTVWNNPPDYTYLAQQSAERIAKDSIFILMKEDAHSYKQERDSTLYSLNMDEYRLQDKRLRAENKHFEVLSKTLPFEEASIFNVHKNQFILSPINDTGSSQRNSNGNFYGVAGTYKVLISATTDEQNKMRADTNEANSENIRLKRMMKDPELFEATRVIGDMK